MADTDNKSDQLPHSVVLEHLRVHDRGMRKNRHRWALYKSTYLTRYWDFVQNKNRGSSPAKRLSDVEVEVNRMWGVLSTYLSALYPRASRAVFGPDPAGRGDANKSALAVNRWLASRKIHQRVMTGLRQSLLYPGCGAKIGYTPGAGSALDRVWLRVIPWWEILLDNDVSDAEDERFRGHVYFRPKIDVEREYGLEDLAGTRRVDFLAEQGTPDGKSVVRKKDKANSDEAAFVRVLELCNLKDTIQDEENEDVVYQGRLEIYVLGQGALSKTPVYVGPLPFANPDGTATSHIVPLIFNSEPEFPLRGISQTSRLMPQIRELNAYRSFMAMATRKDTRQYVTRKGTLSGEEMTNLTEGYDGLILQVDQSFDRPLTDAIIPVQNSPISSNIDRYLNEVERDLERVIGTSPQARGQLTKATAFEVQTVQMYTESEFGMHAAIKDEWLASVVKLLLRALIAAMTDRGDSRGAFEGQETRVAEVGAIPDEGAEEKHPEPRGESQSEPWTVDRIRSVAEKADIDVDSDDFKAIVEKISGKTDLGELSPQELQALGSSLGGDSPAPELDEEEEAQAKQALVDNISAGQEPYVDDDVVEPLGVIKQTEDTVSISQDALMLRERGETVLVTVHDLDADFDISFVEGGRTPLTDAAMQQNLVALLQPYTALWQAAQQPGADGVLAKSYMKVIAERFDLPKDLHPDELLAEVDEQEKEEEEKAKEEEKEAEKEAEAAPGAPPEGPPPGPPGTPPPGPPGPPGAPPPGPPGAPPPGPPAGPPEDAELQAIVGQIAQLPPDQAIVELKKLFASDPEMLQMLASIEAMPPEQQAETLGQMLGATGAPV